MTHRTLLATLPATAVAMMVAAAPALAYVGPGAGLSLLGALWGVVAAIVAALSFMIIWPLRRMLVRRRANRPAADRGEGSDRLPE